MRDFMFIVLTMWFFGVFANGQSDDKTLAANRFSTLKSGTQLGVNIKASSGLGVSYDFTLPSAVPGTANSPLISSVAGVLSYGIPLPTSAGSSGQLLQTNGTSVVLTTATYPGTAGTNGTIPRSNGTNFVNTSTIWPTTSTVNRILYSSSTNTIDEITTGNSGTLITSAGGVPSISSTLPTAVQDNITRLGTVASGVWNGTTIAVANGGTNGTATPTNGGVAYGTGSAYAFSLAGSSGQILTSAGAASPVWTTATYPSTSGTSGTLLRSNGTNWVNTSATFPTSTTANQILYSSATNTVGGISAGASGVLVTDASSVPSISSTLPSAVQGNITTLGTVSTALTLSAGTNSTSTSSGTLIITASGGIGFGGSMYGGGTTNQLGAPQTFTTGYTGFSGNIAANSTGITDTQRAIGLVSNAYYSTNAPTRLANLSGVGIIAQARTASTSAVLRFETNTVADGTTASTTLRAFMDAFGAWTFGSSGTTIGHTVNGSISFVGAAIDTVQAIIAGYSTQTSNILDVQKSDATKLLSVTNVNGTKIRGTTTNDSAAAGFVGEVIEEVKGVTAMPVATNTIGDCSSIPLTAGDWLVSFVFQIENGATTVLSSYTDAWISSTSGNSSTGRVAGSNYATFAPTPAGTNGSTPFTLSIPSYRVSLSGSTTYYLKCRANWTSTTPNYYSRFTAVRTR